MKKTWSATVVLAMFACTVRGAEATKADAAPNIIVILADDLGHADIGAQGVSKDVRTPNIDSIAAGGARFTNAYVSSPVCSPSRAGFLTGRYQERFGHELNPTGEPPEKWGLPLDQVLLPQPLKARGYATALVGKWHEGNLPKYHPQQRGFDEFFGFLGGMHSYIVPGRGFNALLRGTEPVEEKEYLTDAFSREAVSFIDRHKSEPFFLYLAYNAVHVPQQVTDKYADRFPDEKNPKRRNMLAMLSAEDDGVGRVLKALRDDKLEENTIVFFFSDNGGPTGGNASRNAPFSGFKGQVWEGGIRIPFFVQWKNHIRAGQVIDHPVIALDIFPTAVNVAHAQLPSDRPMDGVDLMPLLSGQSQAPPHENLYWRYGLQGAVRHGNDKMVRMKGAPDKLFDLAKDPGEKNDLADQRPQVLKDLQQKYDGWTRQLVPPLWLGGEEYYDTEADIHQRPKRPMHNRKGPPGTEPAD